MRTSKASLEIEIMSFPSSSFERRLCSKRRRCTIKTPCSITGSRLGITFLYFHLHPLRHSCAQNKSAMVTVHVFLKQQNVDQLRDILKRVRSCRLMRFDNWFCRFLTRTHANTENIWFARGCHLSHSPLRAWTSSLALFHLKPTCWRV